MFIFPVGGDLIPLSEGRPTFRTSTVETERQHVKTAVTVNDRRTIKTGGDVRKMKTKTWTGGGSVGSWELPQTHTSV